MNVDLSKGISIRISGELGKYNTLPVDTLIKISQSLQDLVMDIAKTNLSNEEPVDLNNFKIELSGFSRGSAVPQFSFTHRLKPTINDVHAQRNIVNTKLDEIAQIAHEGGYSKLKEIYPEATSRNLMVNSLYSFVNSFGNAPVSFVGIDDSREVFEIYELKKFKSETRNSLLTKVFALAEEPQENYGVGKIKFITSGKKTTRRIEEAYRKSDTTLSYAPEVIVHNETSYVLNFPLRCSLEKEDGYYIIQSELLDIIGTGETEDEAELNFAEEFSFIFKRYNEIEENHLSKRLMTIKTILNFMVKSIEY